ncbi:homeodomain-interacting protein kinase 1-like [Antennarius striatus]|uniref:homeodomain-interacting protein kinase 1-like n=1 Tax=Antennarius striatus TaxID=241820 RepID=UPI0035B33AB4
MEFWHEMKKLRQLVLHGDLEKISANPTLCKILDRQPESKEEDAVYSVNSRTAEYSVFQKLGAGVFGEVFRGQNEKTKKQVVLKKMKEDSGKKHMKRELSVLKYLKKMNKDSKYTVDFFESFEDREITFLVFEKLDETLFDAIADDCKPMSLRVIRPIAKQLFLALEELRAVNILHTDIKPDNIMFVDKAHQPYRIKLIDFGLALKASKVQPEMVVQAPAYRAPEVLLGLPFNEAIDTWAVGCTLAFLFMAHHLFHGKEPYLMTEIVELLGQPNDQLLSQGMFTEEYFIQDQAANGATWKLKSPEESEVKCKTVINHLLDLMNIYPSSGVAESWDRMNFIFLLKGLLNVDMNKRLSAQEALRSPFITMEHLTRQFEETDYLTLSQETMNMCPTLSTDQEGSLGDFQVSSGSSEVFRRKDKTKRRSSRRGGPFKKLTKALGGFFHQIKTCFRKKNRVGPV